ncbi:efflux RND transporter periplasmic adaptor subunit [Mangrovibacterium diazotrophicum]|uniref:RND family efflux transporter MFP subunit n=1 Tax=Mangrovibacterium diazotrophicum TaxID=1261403 RepID=A0A419WBI0_9BACT|nr:efflux RND transporter periplasmic adaptor subunit [Mangrovibacterium diazotrophicum]RKD92813.1 RND family efflux transporter MFP subunit [Mangrovibacterium diazotrophicum]
MKLKLYTPIAFAALLAFSACSNQSTNAETDTAIPVSVEDIKLGSIEQTINTTGTVTASEETTLSTETDGNYVLKVNPRTGRKFALGDMVEKGQLIIELEDKEYLNGIGLEAKELNLKIAQQTYDKQKSLYDKGGVTLSELSSAQVSLVDAKDAAELAQIQLEKMQVRAPFKGVITELPTYTQYTKVASGTEVVSLMSYSKLMLEANLPEKYINDLKSGQEIRVMNYTLPDDTLHGRVEEISPAISTDTRTFTTKMAVENPGMKLRPGMYVQAEVILDRKDSVVVIPKDVVVSSRRGKIVYVVSKGTAEEKQVTFGYEEDDRVEITSGLKANDRLVVKGFETLRNRSKVKIIK